jgi:kinesin family protein 6/9
LQEELRLLKGDDADRGPITESEIEQIGKQIERYIQDPSAESALNVGASMMHIRAAFDIFKKLCKDKKGEKGTKVVLTPTPELPKAVTAVEKGAKSAARNAEEEQEVKRLRLQLQQRDNEVNILVSMLKRKEHGGVEASSQTGPRGPEGAEAQSFPAAKPSTGPLSQASLKAGSQRPELESGVNAAPKAGGGFASVAAALIKARSSSPSKAGPAADSARAPVQDLSLDLLADRNKAFEM